MKAAIYPGREAQLAEVKTIRPEIEAGAFSRIAP